MTRTAATVVLALALIALWIWASVRVVPTQPERLWLWLLTGTCGDLTLAAALILWAMCPITEETPNGPDPDP